MKVQGEKGGLKMEIMVQRRKEMKLNQTELALSVGCSQRAIAGYELDERRPSVPMAKKIGAVLGFDWKLFYDDEAETQGAAGNLMGTRL